MLASQEDRRADVADTRRMRRGCSSSVCRCNSLLAADAAARCSTQALVDALELQRSVEAAVGQGALAVMPPAARERALRAELRAAGALHPALCAPTGHYKVCRVRRAPSPAWHCSAARRSRNSNVALRRGAAASQIFHHAGLVSCGTCLCQVAVNTHHLRFTKSNSQGIHLPDVQQSQP